jgi:hypothetical protein
VDNDAGRRSSPRWVIVMPRGGGVKSQGGLSSTCAHFSQQLTKKAASL